MTAEADNGQITKMIGRYRVTGMIGSGSFATIDESQDCTLDVPVSFKPLTENVAGNLAMFGRDP